MMQDIVDLRNNNWVPRREDNNPKTIDQIHKEAADQAKKTQIKIQMAKQERKLQRGAYRLRHLAVTTLMMGKNLEVDQYGLKRC